MWAARHCHFSAVGNSKPCRGLIIGGMSGLVSKGCGNNDMTVQMCGHVWLDLILEQNMIKTVVAVFDENSIVMCIYIAELVEMNKIIA